MKKKIIFLNFSVSLMVLFAMLFQTVHSYEHIYKQITENHCDHSNSKLKNQITHSHSAESNCAICHFAFSPFTPTDFYSYSFTKVIHATPCVFYFTKVKTAFFKGSLFALRAPPVLV
ncbi:hypothetical protein [Flavobacterium hydrocarbonoxydans]|uniref:hypothetical protein n=1 Tax=Flavobacterium hydrocarbonoxydans TaxID=2683249 RepID=UPI0019247319|nr:hypothetical protein [Flavobacterium hydrocarbonoxydans]